MLQGTFINNAVTYVRESVKSLKQFEKKQYALRLFQTDDDVSTKDMIHQS